MKKKKVFWKVTIKKNYFFLLSKTILNIMSSGNLIDLNSRRLRGQSRLDEISKPYFGFIPDDGRVFSRRNSHVPLNRQFSNGQWNSYNSNQDYNIRENYNSSYRYNNPFAVGNSQTYKNPNFKSRYTNADFAFPMTDPGPGPGDGFNTRQAVYGKPYGGFNPPGAGRNRISGRSIADDQDVETYVPLSSSSSGYNPFGFPEKKKRRQRDFIEGYQSSESMMQSPYKLPLNGMHLPTSIHENFSKMKQKSNAFGVPVHDATVSRQSRLWDEIATAEANRDRLQPEMFSPKTNDNDKMVLVYLLILTFILLVLTMIKKG